MEGSEYTKERKYGLVLEGGGMRGIYTAGVLDEFLEAGISFDGVIGVSAGAIHGCSFVSGQMGRSIRYYKKYCGDKRFLSVENIFRTGNIVDTEFAYHELPEILDPYDYEAFDRSAIRFYVTVTNLETGKAEYPEITDMREQIDLMRASASLPYVSRPVEQDGKLYLDGGCADSIPAKAFQRMGYEKLVVVRTRHQGYVKKPSRRGLASVYFHQYPKFAKALKDRHKTYNNSVKWIRRQEEAGNILTICPSRELTVHRTSATPEELQEAYDLGRADARERMHEVRAFLTGKAGE